MRRATKKVLVWVAILGLLALASKLTTEFYWDGGFPSGEFRVKVADENQRPVRGAVLRTYRGGTTTPSYAYPLENHTAESDLVSDGTGLIMAVRTEGGLQFGGRAWLLFWCIPMGAKAPEYDCEITAEGFKPLRFPLEKLFASPHRGYENFPKSDQRKDEYGEPLKIYENTFTLQR